MRDGVAWKLWYSYDPGDPNTPWLDAGGATVLYHGLNMAQIGVFAGNAGANPPAFKTLIDYVYSVSGGGNPNDTKALTLDDILALSSIDPESVGQISGEPINSDPENPDCGDPFRLTANPTQAGWAFSAWRGTSFTSEDNPFERSFAPGEQVVAEFNQFAFTLTTPVVNQGDGDGGSVSRSPNKPLYTYGESVILTATVNDGWRFDGWSGDVNDDKFQSEIVLNQSSVVTATFIQEYYTVLVDVEDAAGNPGGNSIVVVSPPAHEDGYLYGERVTLTAAPAPGYRFNRWTATLPAQSFRHRLR